MPYTYEELKEKTVAELREIAKDIEDERLQGYTTMHKEQLFEALCKVLGVKPHEERKVVGIDKAKIKREIKGLKAERDEAIKGKDYKRLKEIRRRIHRLKRVLRRSVIRESL